MEEILKNKTDFFWNWFKDNNKELSSSIISETLINELNAQVLNLENLNWEVRKGVNQNNMLIISAGGDNNLFPIAKSIINMAPDIKDWEFYYYKPAKNWDYKLELKNYVKFDKELDVKDWEYILLKFKDNTFDIVIKAKNLNDLKKDDQYTIADIVLESILGDELSYSLIKNVRIVDEFDKDDLKNKNSIKDLANHIHKLI